MVSCGVDFCMVTNRVKSFKYRDSNMLNVGLVSLINPLNSAKGRITVSRVLVQMSCTCQNRHRGFLTDGEHNPAD